MENWHRGYGKVRNSKLQACTNPTFWTWFSSYLQDWRTTCEPTFSWPVSWAITREKVPTNGCKDFWSSWPELRVIPNVARRWQAGVSATKTRSSKLMPAACRQKTSSRARTRFGILQPLPRVDWCYVAHTIPLPVSPLLFFFAGSGGFECGLDEVVACKQAGQYRAIAVLDGGLHTARSEYGKQFCGDVEAVWADNGVAVCRSDDVRL